MMPEADLAEEAGPRRLARKRRAADKADDCWIGPHGRVSIEIVEAVRPQPQARRFERRDRDYASAQFVRSG